MQLFRARTLLALATFGLAGLAVLFVLLAPEIESARARLEGSQLRSIRACLCRPHRDVRLSRDDGLTVAGSLYGVDKGGVRPGILLLHGNTPLGRQLPLYRVLARGLAERGYVVLTIDQSGVGESDDPFSKSREAVEDRHADVRAALDHLEGLPGVTGERLYMVGHSGGAGGAFDVGISDPRVKGIVAIGPPRRVAERLADPKDREYFWNRARENRATVYGEPFPDWYTKEVWLEHALESDMERHLPYFSSEEHKPLLLLDGEKESREERAYLLGYYDKTSPPVRYETIANADHYSNVAGFLGWPPAMSIYDEQVVQQTVDIIDEWLSRAVE